MSRSTPTTGSPWPPGRSSGDEFALARYYRNGKLHRTFSGNGKLRPGFGPGANSVAIDPRDRIVVQGIHSRIVLARFIGYRQG